MTEPETSAPEFVRTTNSKPAEGFAYVYSSGTVISSAAFLADTLLQTGSAADKVLVMPGGTASEITISSGGSMNVSSGGFISGINLESDGSFSGGGFCSGNSKWYGPVICNTGGIMKLAGGTFTDNRAVTLNGYPGQGGAIETFQGLMQISSCVFSGNAATGGGGAVLAISASTSDFFTDTLFQENQAKYGGAVECAAGNGLFTSCTFRSNRAEDGGGLELHSGAFVVVCDTLFESNSAIRGGAVETDQYNDVKSFLRISGGSFLNNTASSGGAVYNIANTVISGGLFENNSAWMGGALYTSGGTTSVVSAVFSGNTAMHDPNSWTDGFGGAADLCGTAAMSVRDTVFDSNRAEYGAAVAAHIAYGSTDSVSFSAEGGTYSSNEANYGGVFYFQGGDNDVMHVSGGEFFGNSASYGGGAVCNCYGLLELSGGTFTANSAANDGGAVANWNNALISNAVFNDNTASFGGAVSNAWGMSLTITNCSFSGNSSTQNGGAVSQDENSFSTTIENSEFIGNTSDKGGAVCNLADAVISGGLFENNSARMGGALYASGGTTSVISAVFSGNTATDDPDDWSDGLGGAIAVHIEYGSTENAAFTANGGTCTDNTAVYGGAFYFQGSAEDIMHVSAVDFSGNSASYGGGAVCNCYGLLEITGGTYSGNAAGNDGGAVANWNNALISNAVFNDNTASFGGAVSNAYGMSLTITNCSFSGNSSTNNGGAVCQDAYSISTVIEDSVFEGNASVNGGAVSNGSVMTVSNCSFLTETDTIANSGTLTFAGANTLDASIDNSGEVILVLSDDAPVLSRWLVNGTGTVSLSVAAEAGTYEIAGDAASFNGTLSLRPDGGTLLKDVLSLSKQHIHDGFRYSLALSDETLTLSVGEFTAPVRGDILGSGCSQILAWDAERGKVGCAAPDGGTAEWRGIWEWSGEQAALWRVAGTGFFAGSQADCAGVLLYNEENSTFAAWTDLGDSTYGYVSLLYTGSEFETVCTTDLDGDGYDDIVIRNDAGAVGIVSGGTSYHDVWHAESDADPQWELLGAGHFGGDQGALLFRHTENGHLYRWDNQDTTYATWNWTQTDLGILEDGWSVAAVGDFQGDGVDDIIILQNETGYVFACEDGALNDRRWVGALDLENVFRIEAVGDYNGDGKDDLLLREYKSTWGGIGCWASGNASEWLDFNVNIETNATGSFQIVG